MPVMRSLFFALSTAVAAVLTGHAIVANASTQVPVNRTITSIGAYADRGYIAYLAGNKVGFGVNGCHALNGAPLAYRVDVAP
jgi:hypothetical protein